MSELITSWLIDGEPTPWTSTFRLDAIEVVEPVLIRTVRRDKDPSGEKKIAAFYVNIHGQKVTVCREYSDTSVPLEVQQHDMEAFRRDLIFKWAAALKDKP